MRKQIACGATLLAAFGFGDGGFAPNAMAWAPQAPTPVPAQHQAQTQTQTQTQTQMTTNQLNARSLAQAQAKGGNAGASANAYAPTAGGWSAPAIAFGEGASGGADCPTEGWSILGIGGGPSGTGGGLFSTHGLAKRCDYRMTAQLIARLSGCPQAGLAYLARVEPDVAEALGGLGFAQSICAPPAVLVQVVRPPRHGPSAPHPVSTPCAAGTHEVRFCLPDPLAVEVTH